MKNTMMMMIEIPGLKTDATTSQALMGTFSLRSIVKLSWNSFKES